MRTLATGCHLNHSFAENPIAKRLTIIVLLLSFLKIVTAQESIFTRSSFLTTGYNQVNEGQNFGLVFRGPGLNYGMTWNRASEKRYISYEYSLGLGILFSRQIPALGFYLKPVDLAYMFRIQGTGKNLYLGPLVKIEYNYDLYPDLQSGFDYWFTNMSLGLGALYEIDYKNSSFRIKLNSSVAGFISRQEAYRNPYFYDIGLNHAVNHLHKDIGAGSFSSFNVSSLEILYKRKSDSRLTFGYFLNYYGFYNDPRLIILNQGVKMIISKKSM